MPIYHHLGNIPQKRHTIFKNEKGNHQYEQLFGTEGFNNHSSLLYHVHRPTHHFYRCVNLIHAPIF